MTTEKLMEFFKNAYKKERENTNKLCMLKDEVIERLQEQLKEAREIIKFYAETTVGHKQKDGTYGMWICSGEMDWENPFNRIKTRMDYICYDPRPAKKWLKKWKV